MYVSTKCLPKSAFLWVGLLGCLFWGACRTQPPSPSPHLQLSEAQKVVFLDSTEAAQAIAQDEKEFFFRYINKLDMSIQLKRAYPDSISRDSILQDYRTSLRASTQNFTSDEIRYVTKAMQEVHRRCATVDPDFFPPEIRLIKAYGYHYGYSVYYTRENCIIIPQGELLERDQEAFIQVMLHEVFHVYSRYHPEKRKRFYERVGFKSIGRVEHLQMSAALRSRILLNPDGINYAYAIRLSTADSTSFQAIPLDIAVRPQYDPGQLDFMAYLEFQLFPIEPPFSRLIKVRATTDGDSPINYKNYPSFFQQIGDNTDYIIHPEEIIADNFVIAACGINNWPPLSETGEQLVRDVIAIIREKN